MADNDHSTNPHDTGGSVPPLTSDMTRAMSQNKPGLLAKGQRGPLGPGYSKLVLVILRTILSSTTAGLLPTRVVGTSTSSGDLHSRELEGLGDALL